VPSHTVPPAVSRMGTGRAEARLGHQKGQEWEEEDSCRASGKKHFFKFLVGGSFLPPKRSAPVCGASMGHGEPLEPLGGPPPSEAATQARRPVKQASKQASSATYQPTAHHPIQPSHIVFGLSVAHTAVLDVDGVFLQDHPL
jgi:hypothetical protein